MTASPTQCVKCGHQFPPHAPEPSWCPGCGRLCSAFDSQDEPAEPEPEEIPETPQEQHRLRVWFWVFFLGGPVVAGLAFFFGGNVPSLLPAALRPPAFALPPGLEEPLLALFAGAGGAGFCVARTWYPRRSLGAQLLLGAALGPALIFAYVGIAAMLYGLYQIAMC